MYVGINLISTCTDALTIQHVTGAGTIETIGTIAAGETFFKYEAKLDIGKMYYIRIVDSVSGNKVSIKGYCYFDYMFSGN